MGVVVMYHGWILATIAILCGSDDVLGLFS